MALLRKGFRYFRRGPMVEVSWWWVMGSEFDLERPVGGKSLLLLPLSLFIPIILDS